MSSITSLGRSRTSHRSERRNRRRANPHERVTPTCLPPFRKSLPPTTIGEWCEAAMDKMRPLNRQDRTDLIRREAEPGMTMRSRQTRRSSLSRSRPMAGLSLADRRLCRQPSIQHGRKPAQRRRAATLGRRVRPIQILLLHRRHSLLLRHRHQLLRRGNDRVVFRRRSLRRRDVPVPVQTLARVRSQGLNLRRRTRLRRHLRTSAPLQPLAGRWRGTDRISGVGCLMRFGKAERIGT